MAKEIDSLEKKAYTAYKPRITGALGQTINLMLELNEELSRKEVEEGIDAYGDISDKIFCYSTIPVRKNLFNQIAEQKDEFNRLNPSRETLETFKSYIELKMPTKIFAENEELASLHDIYQNTKKISSQLKILKTIEEVCQKKAIVDYKKPDPKDIDQIKVFTSMEDVRLAQEKKYLEDEITKLEAKFATIKTTEEAKIKELAREKELYLEETSEPYRIEVGLIEKPDQIEMIINAYDDHMEGITGERAQANATHKFVETKLATYFPMFVRAMTDKDTRAFYKRNKIALGTAINKWGPMFGYSMLDAKKIKSGRDAPSTSKVLKALKKRYKEKSGGFVLPEEKKREPIKEKEEQTEIIRELPKGIIKWTDFIKIDLLKGMSMAEKAAIWREYVKTEIKESPSKKKLKPINKGLPPKTTGYHPYLGEDGYEYRFEVRDNQIHVLEVVDKKGEEVPMRIEEIKFRWGWEKVKLIDDRGTG